jgi:hypothetical protein
MKIRLEDGLPIVSGSITIAGKTVELDGIVGTDVLRAMGAVIDLGSLDLRGPAVRRP